MPTIERMKPAPPEGGKRDGRVSDATKPASRFGSDLIASATRTLREQGMPPEEVETVLHVEDPQVLRRYMELHGERLDERLAAERRALAWVERSLALAILQQTDNAASRRDEKASPPDKGRFI